MSCCCTVTKYCFGGTLALLHEKRSGLCRGQNKNKLAIAPKHYISDSHNAGRTTGRCQNCRESANTGLPICCVFSLYLSPDKGEFDVMFRSTVWWKQAAWGGSAQAPCCVIYASMQVIPPKKKSNNKEAEIKYTLSKCLHIINAARLWTTPWIKQADVCFYSLTGSEWCAGSRCWCAQEIATRPFIFISCRNLTSSLTNTPIKPLGVCRSHHRGWTGTNGSPAGLSILFSSPRTMATWE